MINKIRTMIRGTIFLFCFAFTNHLFAQIDSALVNTSPYSAIYNHLYYLQPDSYQPARAGMSFSPAVKDRRKLAVQLKQILDGSGLYVDINRLPKEGSYFDSLSNSHIYFIDRDHPLIYVERMDSLWFYSRTTIEAIPDLHRKLYPFGTQIAVYFEAPIWQTKLLNIELWKWLALCILLFLSLFVFYLVNLVSNRIFGPVVRSRLHFSEEASAHLRKLSHLIGLIIAVRFLAYLLPMIQLPAATNAFVVKGLGILGIFFVIFAINRLVAIFFHYMRLVTQKTSNTLDDQLLPVLKRIIEIVIWSLGLFYALDFLGVNVTALLAGISIGGLAIALAAQDTVKNFFGSIMIFVDKPFQIGDWIHFGDVDGIVEEVGVRSTRVRTFSNSLTYVPNALLANQVVDNMGLRKYRRFKTEIGITYDTPPTVIDLFVKGIREIILAYPAARKDYFEVHLNNLGSSSINILLYMFFEAPNWTSELRGRHDIIYAIMVLAEELGVRFAFPTQTLHIEEMPGQIPNTPKREAVQLRDPDLQKSLSRIKDYFAANLKVDVAGGDKIQPLGGE